MHYLRGVDEAGRAYAVNDPLADALSHQWALAAHAGSEPQRTALLTAFTPVFGELGADPRFVSAVARQLERLQRHGVVAALAAPGAQSRIPARPG